MRPAPALSPTDLTLGTPARFRWSHQSLRTGVTRPRAVPPLGRDLGLSERRANRFEDGVGLTQNVLVPKPQHAEVPRCQPGCAAVIPLPGLGMRLQRCSSASVMAARSRRARWISDGDAECMVSHFTTPHPDPPAQGGRELKLSAMP